MSILKQLIMIHKVVIKGVYTGTFVITGGGGMKGLICFLMNIKLQTVDDDDNQNRFQVV